MLSTMVISKELLPFLHKIEIEVPLPMYEDMKSFWVLGAYENSMKKDELFLSENTILPHLLSGEMKLGLKVLLLESRQIVNPSTSNLQIILSFWATVLFVEKVHSQMVWRIELDIR